MPPPYAVAGPTPSVHESYASRLHLPLWRDLFALVCFVKLLRSPTSSSPLTVVSSSFKLVATLATLSLTLRAVWEAVARIQSRQHAGPYTIEEKLAQVKPTGKTVAIIGTGISGIQATKNSLAEGVLPTVFEADSEVGGFWRYKEEIDQPSIYESTHIDTDRDLAGYADAPWHPNVSLTIKNDILTKYLKENVEMFGLRQYIRFNTKVILVAPNKRQVDGRYNWAVTYELPSSNGQEKVTRTEVFDAVLVATGRHGGGAAIPNFDGMHDFQKPIIHSSQYKTPAKHGIDGTKTVVVVGIGNSGLDTVTEVSPVAKNTILVSRSGAWITRAPHGDIAFSHDVGLQITIQMFLSLPFFIATEILERVGIFMFSDMVRDQAILNKHNLKPHHRMSQQHPLMSGLNGHAAIHDELEAGRITVKKGIAKFTSTAVVFTDGTQVEPDLVVLATGYKQQASFVDPTVVDLRFNRSGNDTFLYKAIFPCKPEYSTLGFVNFQQTITFFASDLQTRAFYEVFFGRKKLPSEEERIAEVKDSRLALCAQYIDRAQLRNQHGANFMYYDDLANFAGVNPTFSKVLLERPSALWHSMFTTWSPLMYRLVGPGRLEVAERLIEERHWTRYYGPYPDGTPRPTWDRTGLMAIVQGLKGIVVCASLTLIAKALGYKTGGQIRDHLKQNLDYAEQDIKVRGIPHALEWGVDAQIDLKRKSVWGKE